MFGSTPIVFVSDNSREYMSHNMKKMFDKYNIQHQPTTPYSSQENDITEHLNQSLLNAVRAAIITAELPPP